MRLFSKLLGYCFLLILISACVKQSDDKLPVITFITEPGYYSKDSIVKTGQNILVGIHASSEDEAITNLVVSLETPNGKETAIDSGLYKNSFLFSRNISFGAGDWEKWTFTVMDKNRNKASVSIRLERDTASVFGSIISYPSIILGTQHNANTGQFLLTSNGSVLTETAASAVQDLVNIILYYGDLQVPETYYTFSSPNETDAPNYYPSLNSWTTPKNEIRYKADSLSISSSIFNACNNDSLIISNYTSATAGKRKFKNAKTGYVIPFQFSIGPTAGKRGLIYVKSCSSLPGGTMEIALKMQE
jgi:hypothetical protein